MMMLKVAILVMLISGSNQQYQSTPASEHCGQYGFRCVDVESFQICTYPDLDGITDAPEAIHKCKDHNVCDEDNPAYCTPLDKIENDVKEKPNGKCQKKIFGKRSQDQKSRNANVRESFNDIENMDHTFIGSTFGDNLNKRNIFNNEDDDEIATPTTTTEDYDYPSFQYQKFECENFGYFPDVDNASMFWHCDHQNKGKGYIVRHMICSRGRVFDPIHKECVMIGTTRNIRKENHFVTSFNTRDEFKNKRKSSKNIATDMNSNFKFSCKNRMPGKYSDESDCRLYHYCLPKSFAPFNELALLCPEDLAYDDEKETCNRKSFQRCAERVDPRKSNKLHIEIDAIVLQKKKCKIDKRRHNPADCSEYHLCYNDEVVHLKCPDSYRFNENLLTCQPQHLVSCEYET